MHKIVFIGIEFENNFYAEKYFITKFFSSYTIHLKEKKTQIRIISFL